MFEAFNFETFLSLIRKQFKGNFLDLKQVKQVQIYIYIPKENRKVEKSGNKSKLSNGTF